MGFTTATLAVDRTFTDGMWQHGVLMYYYVDEQAPGGGGGGGGGNMMTLRLERSAFAFATCKGTVVGITLRTC